MLNAGQRGGTCQFFPVNTKAVPVFFPNWTLSKRILKVNLGQECAASKLLANGDGIVHSAVPHSELVGVNMVIDAMAKRS